MKQLAHSTLKECFVFALRISGVLRLFRWLNRDRLIILTYHGVLPSTIRIDGYESRNVVDEDMFAWQMGYLATHYRCLPLEDAVERLAGNRPLPPYAVAVTFDDGFRNNLRFAAPILRRTGIPATVFLTTGHIGQGAKLLWTERVGRLLARAVVPQTVTFPGDAPRTLSWRTAGERDQARRLALQWLKAMASGPRDQAIQELEDRLEQVGEGHGATAAEPNGERYAFLTWEEAGQLASHGVTVGSHTVHHPILTSLDHDRRAEEVVESKQQIEQHLNTRCALFSYPNGTARDFDERDKANLRRAGYVAAVSQIAGVNDKTTDRFALRRLNIGRGHTPGVFIAQVSGAWPWTRSIGERWSRAMDAQGRALAQVSLAGLVRTRLWRRRVSE